MQRSNARLGLLSLCSTELGVMSQDSTTLNYKDYFLTDGLNLLPPPTCFLLRLLYRVAMHKDQMFSEPAFALERFDGASASLLIASPHGVRATRGHRVAAFFWKSGWNRVDLDSSNIVMRHRTLTCS